MAKHLCDTPILPTIWGYKKKFMNFFVVEEYVCEDVYVFCLPPGLTKTITLVACFKQNLCLDFFTQWFKNKVEVKCVLECMFNKCVSFFFSSSDCLLLVSIIQTIQLIIYHEKHRHGTKFQF